MRHAPTLFSSSFACVFCFVGYYVGGETVNGTITLDVLSPCQTSGVFLRVSGSESTMFDTEHMEQIVRIPYEKFPLPDFRRLSSCVGGSESPSVPHGSMEHMEHMEHLAHGAHGAHGANRTDSQDMELSLARPPASVFLRVCVRAGQSQPVSQTSTW